MKDEDKTREQLVEELADMRRRISGYESGYPGISQAEEELARFKAISDHANYGIAISDTAGCLIYINEYFASIHGYSPDELTGKSINIFHNQEQAGKVAESIQRLRDTGNSSAEEVWHTRRDGSLFPMLMNLFTIKDNCGKPPYMATTAVDITERKREEEELERYREHLEELVEERAYELIALNEQLRLEIDERKRAEESALRSKRYYRSLIRNAPDMVSVYNADGSIRWASRTAARITGYTSEDAYGRNFLDFVHPDDKVIAETVLGFILLNPGVPRSIEGRFRQKDGSYHFHEATFINLLDDPYVRGIVVNARDISERKMIEERLENINRLFLGLGADLIENVESIVQTGNEILGGALMAYSRLEKGRLSILSTAPGEEAFTVTNRPEDFVCCEVISAQRKEPLVVEDLGGTRYRDTDPKIERYGLESFLGYPVELQGNTIGCLCLFDTVARDFSHEDMETLGTLARAVSIEEERISHEEGLKDLIDIASHELRHPITILKGYATTLRESEEKLNEDQRREFLEIIGRGADRLNGLVLGLLEVSRIERGRLKIERREACLNPLVEQAVGEMRSRAPGNEFDLSIPGEIYHREVDPERILELLVILLDNAVEYSPPDSRIDTAVTEGAEETLVSVMDRGRGIPRDDRERVFERFYQVDDALHHSKPGIGLGLYIAREIVEAHGGRIWCEPREGGGSVFRLTIPR